MRLLKYNIFLVKNLFCFVRVNYLAFKVNYLIKSHNFYQIVTVILHCQVSLAVVKIMLLFELTFLILVCLFYLVLYFLGYICFCKIYDFL